MSNKNQKHTEAEQDNGAVLLANAKKFWTKNGKQLSLILGALVLVIGGYFLYKNYVQKPKEIEALDKSFKAEEFYKLDSFNLALNGDGVNPGFIKIAEKYSGTPTGNMANFYAGVSYLKLNQNEKAVKYLKEFSSSSKPVQQRAYKLLGDAYGDMGNGKEALEYYKKAARHFVEDQAASADALFSAAYLAQNVLNDPKEAITLYKELKEKFGRTQQGFEADKYLAQLGVYNAD